MQHFPPHFYWKTPKYMDVLAFGIAKNAYFPDKRAPYIGICQFKVPLLSERPWVRIPPGTPKTPRNTGFFQVSSALFFCALAKNWLAKGYGNRTWTIQSGLAVFCILIALLRIISKISGFLLIKMPVLLIGAFYPLQTCANLQGRRSTVWIISC